MNEKVFNNQFKLVLTQGSVLYYERIFDANCFYPLSRYSVDIKSIMREFINKMQKCLSKRVYDTEYDVGNDKNYNVFQYFLDMKNKYPKEIRNEFDYDPKQTIQQFDGRTIKGVEFKIGLYLNEKPIVERLFYVDGFNPVSRWSVDIVELMDNIVETIYWQIIDNDFKNIWDDYDLINEKGLPMNVINEFTKEERERVLSRLSYYN